ncbi:unnamed protein product [Dibothriocephalus latus]|uniref:Uncharacterized protein n=1 Tax=Dibothriocephalus latus TaxID=60516 RepID=A0A3P7M7Y1_DIBLA|nr:unnamed protein product [Dibothriocephalus latus]
MSGLLGHVKASLKATGHDLLEADLSHALANTSAEDASPLMMEFAFDKVNKGNGAALEWAKRTADSLSLPEPLSVRPEAFKDLKSDPQAKFAVMRLICSPDAHSEWQPTWRQFREELYRAARLGADSRSVPSSSSSSGQQHPL